MKFEPKTYEETRTHFILRLKERYNIEITNEEYENILLNNKIHEPQVLYSINSKAKLVWVNIKNKQVLCIYKKKEKGGYDGGYYYSKMPARLATCLTLDGHTFPCPHALLRCGYTKGMFEEKINEVIKKINETSYELERLGQKDFFIKNTSHQIIKAQACNWRKRGTISFGQIIEYLEYKHIENRILKFVDINTES